MSMFWSVSYFALLPGETLLSGIKRIGFPLTFAAKTMP